MEQKIVYTSDMTIGQLIDLVQSGKAVACPKCQGHLLMVSGCMAEKLGVHEGIYCSNDLEHVRVVVDVAPPDSFWDQFKQKGAGPEAQPKL